MYINEFRDLSKCTKKLFKIVKILSAFFWATGFRDGCDIRETAEQRTFASLSAP